MKKSNFNYLIILASITLSLSVSSNVFSQNNNYNQAYTMPGVVVLNSFDTLKCDIIYMSDVHDCEFVVVSDNINKKILKYIPDQVLSYKRGDSEFHSILLRGDLGIEKKVFMKSLVAGPISLYAYHFITGSFNYQKEVIRYYLIRKGEDAIEVRKYNYSKTVSNYISDCPILANQVRDGVLKFDYLEKLIIEYNRWALEQRYEQQKVKKDTILESNNNLSNTISTGATDSGNGINLPETGSRKRNKKTSYPRFGVDLPLFVCKNYVDVMPQLKEQIKYFKGGIGYDLGVGIRVDFSSRVSLKIGVNTWNRIFNINYPATMYDNVGHQTDVTIKEKGVFLYNGGYVKIHYNAGPIFAGAGINFTLNGKYKSDFGVYNVGSSYPIFEKKHQTSSPLVEKEVSELFDIILTAGFRIEGNGQFCIKPAVELSLGAKPTVKTGAWEISVFDGERNDLDIYTLSLKFGIIVEF